MGLGLISLLFIRYIYTDQVDLKSFDQACELTYAAKKYMVSNLMEKCSQFMRKDLIPENVFSALEYANLHEDTTLKVLNPYKFEKKLHP